MVHLVRGFIERDFPRLLDLLYDAALDPTRWQAFLDRLGPCFGGANGILHTFDKDTGFTELAVQFGSDPAYAASYTAHYWSLNPYPRLALTLPIGKALPASSAAGTEHLHRSEFFNDWMKPQGIPVDHLAALLSYDGSQGVVLGVAPHASVYYRNRTRYGRQMQMLIPHITRALEINRVAVTRQRTEAMLGTALDTLGAAAILIAGSGRVVLANKRGEDLMRSERVLSVDRHGAVYAARPRDDGALQAAIAASARSHIRTLRPVRLASAGSGRSYIAWVLPARGVQDTNGAAELSATGPDVLLLIVPTDRGTSVPTEAIAAVFGLSAAEARLASALCAGMTLDQYAAAMELSRNTVRNQLAAAFAKTGTSRQTELVALLVSALALAAPPRN